MAAAFAVGFALAAGAGELSIATGLPLGGARIVLDRSPPTEPGYYYGFSSYGGIEHDVYYFALDDWVEHARNSDVMAFGHSHVQLALRPDVVLPKMEALGLRFFNLSFAPGESVQWALDLVRRYDLRPKIAVANVGGFFVPGASFYVDRVHGSDRWAAWQRSFEFRSRWEISRRVYSILPYFDWSPARPPVHYDIYRSSVHGSWYTVREPNLGKALDWPPSSPRVGADSIDLARDFQREIESRGGRLVLFQVPSPTSSPENARELAGALGVPLLEVLEPGLTLTDPGHLDQRSSEVFVRALMPKLTALSQTQELLQERRPSEHR